MKVAYNQPGAPRLLARLGQTLVVPLTLACAIFYPAAGQPALLVPLVEQTTGDAIAWGQDNGAPMVGTSRMGSLVIVRLPNTASALRALASGYLPLAADGRSCGASQKSKDNS